MENVLGLLSLVIISVFVATGEAQSKSFLINCGTNSSINVDGRRWVGDLVLPALAHPRLR